MTGQIGSKTKKEGRRKWGHHNTSKSIIIDFRAMGFFHTYACGAWHMHASTGPKQAINKSRGLMSIAGIPERATCKVTLHWNSIGTRNLMFAYTFITKTTFLKYLW